MDKNNTKFYIIAGIIILFVFVSMLIKALHNSVTITKEQYQKEWAFSVDKLTIQCDMERITAIGPDGQKYYVNGIAAAKYSNNPEYRNISEIQIEDEEMNKIYKKTLNGEPFTPVKKSIDFAVNKGLELCK